MNEIIKLNKIQLKAALRKAIAPLRMRVSELEESFLYAENLQDVNNDKLSERVDALEKKPSKMKNDTAILGPQLFIDEDQTTDNFIIYCGDNAPLHLDRATADRIAYYLTSRLKDTEK